MDTMNRCFSPTALGRAALALVLAPALALSLTLVSAWPAAAQAQNRPFPTQALRGTLVVVQPPEIRLNGQPARLSPGARIRSTNNMLVLSGSLVNQTLTVNYLLEPHGLVHEVWILTPAEAAEKRPLSQP
jgi:hypothetical protein